MRTDLWSHRIGRRQYRYVFVGVWNTLAGCVIFAGLYFFLHDRWHYIAVAVVAHLAATMNSWLSFRQCVFYSNSPWLAEYLRFNLSSLVVLCFQVLGLWFLVDFLGLHPVTSQIGLAMSAALLGYLAHTTYSFRQKVVAEASNIQRKAENEQESRPH